VGKKKSKKARAAQKTVRANGCAPKSLLPKTECCASKSRCTRCPILMLKQGTLPEGMTVRHRKLVGADGKKVNKKDLTRAA
jgi:hypothetical protein